MNYEKLNVKRIVSTVTAIFLTSSLLSMNALAAEDEVASPDKYMIRLSTYFVDQANTDFTILDSNGIGAGISFSDDLGGETTETIPRLDVYYRFNNKHRMDFSTFTVKRDGRKTLTVDLEIGDEVFNSSDTVISDIEYTLYKLGYAYSFYHSPEVELSLSAGLSITSYDLKYSLDTGAKADSVGVSAPLPMFGLRMSYAITPKWSVHYLSETFFIEIEDSIRGALLDYELDIEYKWFKNFSLGAGVTRLSTDLDIKDDDWKGSVKDTHRGFTLYGAFYF